MKPVLIFGLGSSVIVDVEESLFRGGFDVVAAVRNHPGEVFYGGDRTPVAAQDLDPDLRQHPFIVPLFTPAHRQSAARQAAELGLGHPLVLIDPTVPSLRRLDLGAGCYINAGCTLGSCSRFGDYVFVNRGATIGHHALFEDYVSIGPGAVLAAHITIGRGGFVGAGATVLPQITIGANAVIGAGAVVTKDVPAECLVVGNPATIVRQKIGGYHGLGVS